MLHCLTVPSDQPEKVGAKLKIWGSWCSMCLGQLVLEGWMPAQVTALPSLVPGWAKRLPGAGCAAMCCWRFSPRHCRRWPPPSATSRKGWPGCMRAVQREAAVGASSSMLSLGKVKAKNPASHHQNNPAALPLPCGSCAVVPQGHLTMLLRRWFLLLNSCEPCVLQFPPMS